MLVRAMDGLPENAIKLPFLQRAFETIAMAKVSTSAEEAVDLGYLRRTDPILLNGDHLLAAAKATVLGLARGGYAQKPQRSDIPVLGRDGYAIITVVVNGMLEGNFITEHDATIALKLAWILTGGNVASRIVVNEQYLLDLEREAFLSLCGMRKTQERMKAILETGKPLRN